jgi:hypothetical protein
MEGAVGVGGASIAALLARAEEGIAASADLLLMTESEETVALMASSIAVERG